MQMVPRLVPAAQPTVPQLLDAFGSEVERCARLTRELLAGFPEQPELARDVKGCEHEGDRIARELIHALGRSAGAGLPFDAREGLRLATAVDDIVDHLEQAADMLGLYAVEATMEQAIALADVLVCAAGEGGRGAAQARRRWRPRRPPGRDTPPRERGRPPQPRRRRLAVHRPHAVRARPSSLRTRRRPGAARFPR